MDVLVLIDKLDGLVHNAKPMPLGIDEMPTIRIVNGIQNHTRAMAAPVINDAVGTTPELMQNAAIRLLGQNTVQIKQQAEEIIFGQLRQVIASMTIDEINKSRDMFLDHIQRSLEPDRLDEPAYRDIAVSAHAVAGCNDNDRRRAA